MIAVDASVLIEVLFEHPHADTSELAIRDALQRGPLVVCDVAAAEVCARGDSAALMESIKEMGVSYSMIEEKTAMRAGEMANRFRSRQRSQGARPRDRVIPDFLVGAHALMQCSGLITRDGGFHRDYFKGLKVIVPGEQ
ncbi:MAG: type II toxin-antitoxin system VapC family toxin [Casimicrobium sp.]